jgi:hypothetical protein
MTRKRGRRPDKQILDVKQDIKHIFVRVDSLGMMHHQKITLTAEKDGVAQISHHFGTLCNCSSNN